MEFIVGLATGYLLTWPALVFLCILAIWLEHFEATGWSVFFGLIALVVAYFMFEVPLATLAMIVGGYAVAGLLWSFWRYKRFVSKGATEALAKNASIENKEAALARLRASQNLGKITSWFVIWPISIVENLTGDIINLVQTAITEWFHGVYEKIFNSSTGNAYEVIAQQKAAEQARKDADQARKDGVLK